MNVGHQFGLRRLKYAATRIARSRLTDKSRSSSRGAPHQKMRITGKNTRKSTMSEFGSELSNLRYLLIYYRTRALKAQQAVYGFA